MGTVRCGNRKFDAPPRLSDRVADAAVQAFPSASTESQSDVSAARPCGPDTSAEASWRSFANSSLSSIVGSFLRIFSFS